MRPSPYQSDPVGMPVVEPRTETERGLREIWSSLFKTDRISIYDDFMDLGGHSLTARRCTNLIRERFGVEVPIELFFLEPAHIEELALQIDRLRHTRDFDGA